MIPIFRWELVAATRREAVHSQRGYFAGLLLAVMLGIFGAWYYWANGQVTNVVMAEVARQTLIFTIGVHAATIMGPVLVRATMAIAGEKDRRTLEFLLITRLTSAEIVLEKLAARLVVLVSTIAAGVPVMLLLHLLGGIDVRVILLAYAGLSTTAFFISALSMWFSVTSPNARRAASLSVLAMMAWLMGPFFVATFLPRLGLHLPGWAATANAWLVASSPLSVVLKLAMGIGASLGLIDAVAWMAGLQLVGGILLLLGSIVRLRAAYRANVSDENRARGLARKGPVWRWRPRPPVGDDPILWREMYTSRETGWGKALGSIVNLGFLVLLAYATFHYARPALVEVWRHGYRSGVTSAERPEMNLFVGVFLNRSELDGPIDAARLEFNLFVRWITVPIAMILVLAMPSTASEILTRERAKETWTSLLATPLTGREIVRDDPGVGLAVARVPLDHPGPLDARPDRRRDPSAGIPHQPDDAGGIDRAALDLGRPGRLADQGPVQGRRPEPQSDLGPVALLDRRALPPAEPVELGPPRRRLASARLLLVARVLPRSARCLPVCGLSDAALDRTEHRRRTSRGPGCVHARDRRRGPGRLVVLAIRTGELRSPGRAAVEGDPRSLGRRVPTGGTSPRRLGYAETAGSARTIRGMPTISCPLIRRSNDHGASRRRTQLTRARHHGCESSFRHRQSDHDE